MLILTCALNDSPPFRSHVGHRQIVDEFRLHLVIGNRRLATRDRRLEIGEEIGEWRSMSGDRRVELLLRICGYLKETAIFILCARVADS